MIALLQEIISVDRLGKGREQTFMEFFPDTQLRVVLTRLVYCVQISLNICMITGILVLHRLLPVNDAVQLKRKC